MVTYHRVGGRDDNQQDPLASKTGKSLPPKHEKYWQLAFFVASLCAMISGFFGMLLFLIIPFAPIVEPFDFATEIFLIFFGAILFILDAPLAFRWILEAKLIVGRYCRLLTRMTGKGLYLMFLSCMSFNAMYVEEVFQMMGIILSIFIFSLGFVTFAVGVGKTRRLDTVRQALMQKISSQGSPEYLLSFCQSMPNESITQKEFAEMSRHVCPNMVWTEMDLRHITAALSCEQADDADLDIVSVDDLRTWVEPGFALMM